MKRFFFHQKKPIFEARTPGRKHDKFLSNISKRLYALSDRKQKRTISEDLKQNLLETSLIHFTTYPDIFGL